MTTNNFSIVIPSRNAANLNTCINSIRAHNEMARIFVIDDGIEGGYPNAVYITGMRPFIFARNCNLGIVAAGNDDVILMNDDAMLTTDRGFTQLANCRRAAPTILSASINNVLHRPGAVSFACVHIPRVIFDTIGLLDERFVGYGFDDDDFCRRARNAGFAVETVIPEVCTVDHDSLQPTFRPSPRAGVSVAAMRQVYLEKWGRK